MSTNTKKSASLPPLPPNIDFNDKKFTKSLLDAHRSLAELKGYSFGIAKPLLLFSPAILRESIASSEIENIHTTIIEVLQNQLLPESERRENDKEVLHYREAIMWGFDQVKKVGISTRLIVGIQKQLITKENGYRKQQNAIANITTGEIIYTPPIASKVPELISNWENFANDADDGIDPLIKAAILHYQFEAIHPFSDGNGRTGRILMVMQLINNDILSWPILYISGYINRHRTEYYRLLRAVTNEGKWDEFIIYILEGFCEQAKETKTIVLNIFSLLEEMKVQIKRSHNKIYSTELVDILFTYPIITPVKLGREIGVHYTTATRWLSELADGEILTKQKYGKYQLYINKKLIEMLAKK